MSRDDKIDIALLSIALVAVGGVVLTWWRARLL